MDWIINNKEWLFSGAGISIFLFFIGIFIKVRKSKEKDTENMSLNFLAENNLLKSDNDNNDFSYLKNKIRVIFIDDDTKFKIIKILNKAGWQTKIVKDIDNLDGDMVINNHIFFVDINGVGIKMGFKDEGLGLASAIKKKYPEKKVIIYSSDAEGNRFHKSLRTVDDFLPKNAEPFEFQQIIENFSSEIGVL